MSEDTPKPDPSNAFWRRLLARAGFTSYQVHLLVILAAVLALYAGVLGKNIVKMASAGHDESPAPIISQEVDGVEDMETWFAAHSYDLDLDDPGSREDVPHIFVQGFPP
ncbi:MAG: hypothetical protein R3360_07740, partial [Alphaproteobacteria bacterium]|nr:hypothetical protein [Alphaproteobacteria bacterium]